MLLLFSGIFGVLVWFHDLPNPRQPREPELEIGCVFSDDVRLGVSSAWGEADDYMAAYGIRLTF